MNCRTMGLSLALGLFVGLPTSRGEEITYNKHVAPILWKNCAAGHRPGEFGPFSLLEYRDAAKRAKFIGEITASRRMPPWRPEAHFGEFIDVRRLSDEDLSTLQRWVEQGAKEGDAKDLPAAPKFAEGWQLGNPDLVLKMAEEFEIPAASRDIYRCFVIPIDNDEAKTVSGVEFRPGNRRVVHHAIFYLDTSGAARKKDEADPGPGYTSFGGPGIVPSGGLGGWAPGVSAFMLPDGLAKYIKPKSDLVLQIHYHPDGKRETDVSEVGLHFTKSPVKRIVSGVALMNANFNLPAGERNIHVKAEATLPIDVLAIGLSPHMHLLGREMKVEAYLPDGKVEPMIWIKDWDFNWQDAYGYVQPLKLPKGTRLVAEAIYDNSADNPANPNQPPRNVRFGEQTTDEMCLCTVGVIAERQEEYSQLFHMPFARLGAALGGGYLPDPPDFASRKAPSLPNADDGWRALRQIFSGKK